jgi:hypothetical protein
VIFVPESNPSIIANQKCASNEVRIYSQRSTNNVKV